MQVIPWNVDLQDIRFVVARLAHYLQDFLVVARGFLRISEYRDDGKAEYEANVDLHFRSNYSHSISLKELTLPRSRLQIVEVGHRIGFCPETNPAWILERV